jgi:hypothetical protein
MSIHTEIQRRLRKEFSELRRLEAEVAEVKRTIATLRVLAGCFPPARQPKRKRIDDCLAPRADEKGDL